jgi:hypothetical protein
VPKSTILALPSRRWARGLSLLGASTLTGCILLVSPSTGGEACRFSGASTACGACIEDECQSPVNACCDEASCESAVMPLVDGCASKQDSSCTTLAAAAASHAASKLASCVKEKCRGLCAAFSGTSETSCGEPALGGGQTCSCVDSDAPNTLVCSAAVYPHTLCCAPSDWPKLGEQCDCLPSGCVPIEGGCSCSLVGDTAGNVSAECPGGVGVHCCKGTIPSEGSVCRCTPAACEMGQTEVKSCGLKDLACGSGEISVPSCSASR